ncbi:hypothetical protein TWF281_010922 [Arthrobotrys megalospora]
MASLVGLSKAPETLYLILKYLPNADLFALLRTCKSLYPACYRHLWSTLVFDDVTSWMYPGRGISYFRGCRSIQQLIETEGPDNLGFKYTKFLGLGTAMFNFNVRNLKLGKQLGELLENGKLAPQTVEVRFDCLDVSRQYEQGTAQLLLALRKYSKTKSAKELSISVSPEIVRSLHDLFDLEKIVKYDLYVHYGEGSRRTWSAGDRDTGAHLKELSGVLAQTVNLKHFSWKTYVRRRNTFEISDFSEGLGELQATFSNMQHLESLALLDYFFHPSFLLTPPKTVKKLEYGGNLSHHWWQQFSTCPLVGVEDLSIHSPEYPEHFEMTQFLDPGSENVDVENLVLGDVAVMGLKKFTVGKDRGIRGCLPVDLEECILRRNKGIGESYLRKVAETRAHGLISKCRGKILGKITACSPVLVSRYTPRFAEANLNTGVDPYQFTQGYLEMLLQDPVAQGRERESWKTGQERAQGIANDCRRLLQGGLENCINMVRDEYSCKFANGEEPDRNEFAKRCFEMFSKWPELGAAQNWATARSQADKVVEECSGRLMKKIRRDEEGLIKEYTERFLKDEDVDAESFASEWTQQIAKDIGEQDARRKATNFD